MVLKYVFIVTITIEGDETKKNNIRNDIVTRLTTAKNNNVIEEATWEINAKEVSEGGRI